jgi:hypothetical protein
MTYQEQQKFEDILKNCLNWLETNRENRLIFNVDRTLLIDLIKTAKNKNKLNNFLLIDNDKDNDIVTSYECFDKVTNKLVTIAVRPSKKNTVKQMFIYELLKSQYATKQEFTYFKNNVV